MALNEFGEYRRPTPESLANYVLLIIDPNDIGARAELVRTKLERFLSATQPDGSSASSTSYADPIDPFEIPEVAEMNDMRNSTGPLPEALNYPIPESVGPRPGGSGGWRGEEFELVDDGLGRSNRVQPSDVMAKAPNGRIKKGDSDIIRS